MFIQHYLMNYTEFYFNNCFIFFLISINSLICFCDLCYSYHATAALEEAQKLARQKIPSAAALQLHSFTFDDFGLENDEMLQVTKKSFTVHPHLAFSLNYVGVEGLN